MDGFQDFTKLCCNIFSGHLLESHLFQNNFILRPRKELLGSPLLAASDLLPPFRGGVVGELGQGAQEERERADEVDHQGHREPACLLYLRHGACVLWGCLHEHREHDDPTDDVDKVEKVAKEDLRPCDLNAKPDFILRQFFLFLKTKS